MRFDNLHINERTTEACERVTTYYTEANQARGWYSFAVVCLEREGLEVYKDKDIVRTQGTGKTNVVEPIIYKY